MPKAPLLTAQGKKKKDIELKKELFGITPHGEAVHLSVRAFLASIRRGTASTKTRSEVRGGGRKPWPQKGTGRARTGSIRSPLFRGGGVIFGPKPRNYSIKVPKKVKRLALSSALSSKAKEKKVLVLDELKMDTPKTKKAVEILNNLKLSDKKVTLVITEGEENLALSFRNLPTVNIVYADELNAYYALDNDTILFTKRALENLQEVRASGA